MTQYTDSDTTAAARFWRRIQEFSLRAKVWDTDAIFYQVKPDEKHDLTLISQRVYGNRDEYLAVMAAAGVDSIDQELKQKKIILPIPARLNSIKRETGFESNYYLRENFAPIWKEE